MSAKRIILSITPREREVLESGSPEERQRILQLHRTEAAIEDTRRRGPLARLLVGLLVALVALVTVFTAASFFRWEPETGLTVEPVAAVLVAAFAFYTSGVVAAFLILVRHSFPAGE